jgi:hypothetical protein
VKEQRRDRHWEQDLEQLTSLQAECVCEVEISIDLDPTERTNSRRNEPTGANGPCRPLTGTRTKCRTQWLSVEHVRTEGRKKIGSAPASAFVVMSTVNCREHDTPNSKGKCVSGGLINNTSTRGTDGVIFRSARAARAAPAAPVTFAF